MSEAGALPKGLGFRAPLSKCSGNQAIDVEREARLPVAISLIPRFSLFPGEVVREVASYSWSVVMEIEA